MSVWFAYRGLAILAAIAFLLNAILVVPPRTRIGLQCPTAPIQTITITHIDKDCCGHPIEVTERRAPRPGEPGFKQCACAEKKAAQTAEDRAFSKFAFFTLPETEPELRLPARMRSLCDQSYRCPKVRSEEEPPVPPPPDLLV